LVLFCRFFLFGEEKKAAQKREAQEGGYGMCIASIAFLSFSFWATFSPLSKEKKSQIKNINLP